MVDKRDSVVALWETVSYYTECQSTIMGFETQDVERKTAATLRIPSQSSEPVGARIISRNLN